MMARELLEAGASGGKNSSGDGYRRLYVCGEMLG
jgi:hypothetical protein